MGDHNQELVERAFALLSRRYVQRSDGRQRAMGLQYTEAETHDLASLVADFARAAIAAAQSDGVVAGKSDDAD